MLDFLNSWKETGPNPCGSIVLINIAAFGSSLSIFDLHMIAGVLSLVSLRVDSHPLESVGVFFFYLFIYLFLIVVSKVVKAVVLGIHSRPFWLLFPGL